MHSMTVPILVFYFLFSDILTYVQWGHPVCRLFIVSCSELLDGAGYKSNHNFYDHIFKFSYFQFDVSNLSFSL